MVCARRYLIRGLHLARSGAIIESVDDKEGTLTAREALLAETERLIDVGSWAWDAGSGRISCSDNTYRLLGYEPGALPTEPEQLYASVHPDDLERIKACSATATLQDDPAPVECRIMKPDGSVRAFLAQWVPMRDAQGRVVRLVGTLTDLTARREREGELVRAWEMLEDAQQIAKVGSWTWAPCSGEVTWSNELYRIAGLPPGEPVDVETFDALVHPEDLPGLRKTRTRSVATGKTTPTRVRLCRPDGEVRVVELRGRSISGAGGNSFVGVAHDITELHSLEQQLSWSKTMAAAGRLAAGIAHDFNNLLTVILTNAHELSRSQPHEKLEEIVAAVESGAELVRRLLVFGRRSDVEPRKIDLSAVVEDASRWIERLIGDDVAVKLELTTQATPVRADPGQLHQVLLNLATNARDAMPNGGRILITTALVEGDPQLVRLCVSDEGHGMSQETLDHALDPFFSTKRLGEGSGLGLSMVCRVVNELDGEVSLKISRRRGHHCAD